MTAENRIRPVKTSLGDEARERLTAHWKPKLIFTVVLNVLFWSVYNWLSHHSYFTIHNVPKTWLDVHVPLWPDPWAFVYLSQFIYVAAVPWLMRTTTGLIRYVKAAAFLSIVSFLVFIFFPVMGPRPDVLETSGLLSMIQKSDGALNAFPSLHAGFLFFSFAMGWRLFKGRLPWWAIIGCLLWGAGILYSTMATKQHYVADLVVGGILGWLSDWFFWRGADAAEERCPVPAR